MVTETLNPTQKIYPNLNKILFLSATVNKILGHLYQCLEEGVELVLDMYQKVVRECPLRKYDNRRDSGNLNTMSACALSGPSL